MERATTEFENIDLSGEDEFQLPPGVQGGSLDGDDGEESSIPPPKPGEFLTDPEEEKDEEEAPEVTTPVVTSEPEPEPEPEQPEPEPEAEPVAPKPKKVRKRTAKKPREPEPPAPAPDPLPEQTVSENANKKNTSGTIDRPYRIFQIKAAEVDGQILDVPVPVIFNAEGGGTMDTLVARNRDLALTKAARAFGPGWTGTLVAVPIGMWEPEPVFNRPRNSFSVQIGNE